MTPGERQLSMLSVLLRASPHVLPVVIGCKTGATQWHRQEKTRDCHALTYSACQTLARAAVFAAENRLLAT